MPAPIIVVEVLLPSIRTNDLTRKLVGTFQVPSIRHYLIFDANRPSVIHDRRRDDGQDIEARMLPAGGIRLDPPSMMITAKKIYVKQSQ